ncbi:MAG: PQQ-binding-like beta-propeller repeat protein, partial [Planctomycetes bacterium]|nr:PQQ-binding-like beta-propeller repeat protein [Planctomycetota bacterium]
DAGPCVSENLVGVATLRGKAMCYRLEDGAEIWHKDLDCHPGGPMAGIGEVFLFGSREGFLVALSQKNGHEIWRADIGDILLTRPLEVKGGVLVASRSNQLFVFDPAGKKMGEYRVRTWPLHVKIIGDEGASMVACSELSGTVSFLNVPDLHRVRSVALPAQPAGLLFAGKMIPTWGEAGAQLLEERPVLIASDQDGFVYFLDVAAETTTERTE